MKLLLTSILVGGLLAASCGGPRATPAQTGTLTLTPPPGFGGPDDTEPVRHEISIVDFGFQPATYEFSAGQTVMWMNGGNASHTVTFEDADIDSGRLAAGETFEHTFPDAATFEFICTIHPHMRGTLTVTR